MITLDKMIMIVALPSIGVQVGASAAAQLVSVYLLCSGGFLMIGGRLGDLFGYRRVFLTGAYVFTLSSLACALIDSPGFLIAARSVQALGGAIITVAPTSLILRLFAEPVRRTKALGLVTAVSGAAQGIGPFLGAAILARAPSWHCLFLVNIPVGVALVALSFRSLPLEATIVSGKPRDLAKAFIFTMALLLGSYAITSWGGPSIDLRHTLILLIGTAMILSLFIRIESRARVPLIPRELFRLKTLGVASAAGALMGAAFYSSYLVYPSYLQLVLGYTPTQVALALLPLSLLPAVFGFGISAKLVAYLGLREAITIGLSLMGVGLALCARAPVDGHVAVDVLPSMLLLGVGAGIAPVPLFIAATGGVARGVSGLASGAYVTSYAIGSGLGVAILGGLQPIYTRHLVASGESSLVAFSGACHVVSGIGALLACAAVAVAASLPQSRTAIKTIA